MAWASSSTSSKSTDQRTLDSWLGPTMDGPADSASSRSRGLGRPPSEAVGTRTFAFEDGRLRDYPGGWAEYRTAHQADHDEPPPPAKQPDPSRGPEARRRRAAERRATADAKQLERDIERAEAALRELEEELADPSLWADGRTAAKSTRRHEEAKERVEELYARWERESG